MQILVIHPGDSFATADVYDGLCDGLRVHGVNVIEARLDTGLDVFSTAVKLMRDYGYPSPPWAQDVLALVASRIISQAAWLQPAAAIAVTGLKLHYSVPLTLRKLSIPTALLCTESPYSDVERQIAPLYDHVFTHERAAIALFGSHPSLHYLPHAYHPARHTLGPAELEKACDVYFVGTAFPERRALFDGVDWRGIQRVIHGSMWHMAPNALPTPDALANGAVDPWQGVTPNGEAAQWYRSTAICLNHHRTTMEYGSGGRIDPATAQSLGPRAFEIAACGGFQLCDDSRAELRALFGDAVPTYRADDPVDLERQIRWWLARPDERARLAAQQHQAVQGHSWHARAAQILEVLTAGLSRKAA